MTILILFSEKICADKTPVVGFFIFTFRPYIFSIKVKNHLFGYCEIDIL